MTEPPARSLGLLEVPETATSQKASSQRAEIRADMADYQSIVQGFARLGGEIIQTNPRKHYTVIGHNARRPLEPGFIPVQQPPVVVTVSYYPNETELQTGEFAQSRRTFDAWGRSGSVSDYEAAYLDWVTTLDQTPFHRDFNAPVFRELGIKDTQFAWLPLVKCPLPARSAIPDEDVFRDRMLLWDQLSLLRPSIIIAQGQVAYDIVRGMCEDKFPHHMIFQKIGRVGTNAYHAAETERVVQQVRAAMARGSSEV